jgi:circadian clock protein KaiC
MTAEAAGPVQALRTSTQGITFVADNIIVLRYVDVEGDLKRAMGVLKMRGSGHDTSLHELLIDPPHLAVGPRLAAVNLPAAPATWPVGGL